MKTGWNKGKKYRKYKRLTEEQKNMIFKMFEEKTELRKIARILGVELRTVQYHLEKKIIPKPNSLITLKDIIPSINNPFISTKLFYTFFIFHIIS